MTRINTNVSSLVAQNVLGRSNADLNQALTRLSTGLRINTGKDDPAGLIASENLRSDITSIRKAISNTNRANQVIATADSALGQVSSLLNDIRGLVTESANSGALSDKQLSANQLQLDSSLEALNRIAQATTFQGRRLLDGSLDFITTAGTDFVNVTNLEIDQANLGSTGNVSVDISVTAAATQAQVDVANIPAAGSAATAATGTVDIDVSTVTQTIDVTAVAGAAGNLDITIVENASATAGTPVVTGDASSGYTVTVNDTGDTSIAAIASAIEGIAEIATATTSSGADYNGTTDTPPTTDSLTGGADATTGGLTADLVVELAGSTGAEVLSFGIGTEITDLVKGINLVKDATGVEATANGTTLELKSTAYGTNSVVDLKVISEGTGSTPAGTFTTAVGQGTRDVGVDIVASINGVAATGDGNLLSINTATLDVNATIAAGYTGTASFTITGGGALFQLGPDVVSNQQARLGIGSVNTARLGGVSGKLFQLGTGGSAQLSDNSNVAAQIVEEAIDQVTSLRGRLGAFQRTTLETNKNALSDTLVNLTEAESSIRDADFAQESANLTRAQILVQSGTTVLSIANQNPQNVLALLR